MNLKEIKEMIVLMNENGLMELEVEKDGTRIKLKKSSPEQAGMHLPVEIQREQVAASGRERLAQETGAVLISGAVEIKAPMVGTFYRAPSPEAPPYVEVGQTVEPGQVICVIEAMKLMNEIKSEIRGKIVEITVDNAEPVEFGQTMFIIEPL
jgi:oxaloacetate decarboxylase (Na+ extruding) subunit alpha